MPPGPDTHRADLRKPRRCRLPARTLRGTGVFLGGQTGSQSRTTSTNASNAESAGRNPAQA
eukprot:8436909-Lingulodinium_polyedra.AAC.1